MQAYGALMVEHRWIEKMISIIDGAVAQIEAGQQTDPMFIDTVVDFIRIYADRTHHGKEENILFRGLDERELAADDRKLMDVLTDEHTFGRETTVALDEANMRYRQGDISQLPAIISKLKAFVEFYPQHIAKEDKVFFPASRAYFTDEEDQAMLAEFWEYDRKMIHEKYRLVVKSLESRKNS